MFGALFYGAHRTARRSLYPRNVTVGMHDGLQRAYHLLGTVVFGIGAIALLPAGLYQLLANSLLTIPGDFFRQGVADTLTGGVVSTVLWLLYLRAVLADTRGGDPRPRRAIRWRRSATAAGARLVPITHIRVKGAREHNLKNIDIQIPRDKLVVITGLSGSGKSSLAFDTIYAEGQRRYVESLSAYARQFLGQMEKPDVDFIEGLSPAVSIDQKGTTRNPRSTVGTVTEIYDHLRLLFARVGQPHCPNHGVPIVAQTVQEIVDQISEYKEGSRLLILGPLVRDRKGEHQQLLVTARRGGFARVRVDWRASATSARTSRSTR